jgi:putative redox protein
MSFVGESASGHSVVMDGPPEAGGRDLGIRPMEMLLLGLGGCSSFDVVSMLKKGRQNISNCEVEISATRADSEPKVFTDIHLHFIIEGENLNETKVARAINLSAEKYCSASIMLAKTAKVTHDYEIL